MVSDTVGPKNGSTLPLSVRSRWPPLLLLLLHLLRLCTADSEHATSLTNGKVRRVQEALVLQVRFEEKVYTDQH